MKFSDSHAALIEDSYSKIRANTNEFAICFYGRLFETDPGLRALFKSDIAAQYTKFLATISIAIAGLRNPSGLQDAIESLGRRHVGYGVTRVDYDAVGAALVFALEKTLGESFTPATKVAWIDLYTQLAQVMKSASESVPQNESGTEPAMLD